MNKLFTKIVTLIAGLSMAIGVGVAVSNGRDATRVSAADATYSLVPNQSASGSSSTSYVTSDTSFTYNNVSWTFRQWNPKTLQVKANQGNAGSEFCFYSGVFSGVITQVVITFKSVGTVSNTSGFMMKGQATAFTSQQSSGGTAMTWSASSKTLTWTVSSSSGYKAIAFYQNGKVMSGSNYLAEANSIVVTYSSGPTKLATPTDLSYNSANQRVTWSSVSGASSYKFSSDNGSTYTNTGTNLYADVSGLADGTYNAKVVAVGDGSNSSDSDAASFQFTKTAPATYTSVAVTGGSIQGTEKGEAYIQCSASATGTNIPASPTFTWYVTETNTYGTSASVANKASIDTTGKVTFLDNCTVYVWALAPDGTTHNTSGYAATASGLIAPEGSEENPYTVTEAWNIIDGLQDGENTTYIVYVSGTISSDPSINSYNGANFDITDGNKSLVVYSVSGAKITESGDGIYIENGYSVVVSGALIRYVKNSNVTYEVGYKSAQLPGNLVSAQAPAVPEITALALDTSNVTTEFDLNSTFNYSGLVVTATVDGTSGVVISSEDYSVSTPDMTVEGQQTVTITYTGSEYAHEDTISASYTINVNIPTPTETIGLIDAIGTVEYTQACYDKIVTARNSYNALPAASQDKVTNYSTLTTAESTFEDLILDAVGNVENLITNIGTVTLSSGTAISNAETAYAALLDGDLGKSLVNNYETLTTARSTYDGLVADRDDADDVEALIDALPAASSITDYSHHTDIAAAKAAYDALSSSAKGMVDATKAQKLEDCVAADAAFAPNETTISKTMSEIVSENSYTVSAGQSVTCYTELALDSVVTVSTSGNANCGSFWGTSPNNDWRLYQNKDGDITISVGDGYELSSITITYSSSNNGVLLDGSNQINSGTAYTVSGTSVTYAVGNSGSATNGQARVTAISVTYAASSTVTNYTITYLANASEVTGSMSPTVGTNPAVAACAFARDGYSFARWNTQPDGEGDDYAVGTTVSEDITLYAIWQEYIAPIGADVTMESVSNTSSATVVVDGVNRSALKCGTGNKKGEMKLTLEVANITKIKVYIGCWNGTSENTSIDVSISGDATISPTSLDLTKDSSFSGNSSTFTLDGEETAYKHELTISSGAPAGTEITISAQNASNNRFIVWGATNLFAEKFVSEFNSSLTCNEAGTSAPTFAQGKSWSTLESFYNGLDAEEQSRLHDASANESGSEIEQAMARYDYIEGKYNPSNSSSSEWKNFINRSVTPIANGRVLIGTVINANTNTAAVIIIVSVISAAAIGGYFFLRKRKEEC